MGLFARIRKNLNLSAPTLPKSYPTFSDVSQRARQFSIRELMRRRIRLKTISVPLVVVLLFPIIAIVVILVLLLRHPDSPGRVLMPAGGPPSIRKINERHDKVFVNGCLDPEMTSSQTPRANAAFVVLARNKELEGIVQSIKSIERHFNRWFHYPYVFLNDGEFNTTFKEVVTNYTSAPVEFGKITPDMWGYPDWVDKEVAREGIRKQGDQAIMYGGMESYHHMCRFYSGFFYKHPLLDKYKWYWRLEPEIKYFCDITYDPFIHMERNNKTYGFTIAVKELKETVPNIFRYASAYKRLNNLTSQGLWEMFVEKPKDEDKKQELPKDDPKYKKPLPEEIMKIDPGSGELPVIDPDEMEGEAYNMCHFWSNFEIARLDWFRSKEYEDFFQMMDRSGGFWMERWGDAPIHSLAAGALLSVKDVHYFRDFGYRHTTIQHCPANAPARQLPRPNFPEPPSWAHSPLGGIYSGEKGKNIWDEEKKWREEEDYWENFDKERENGVGCRCKCDTDIVDVEGKEGSCLVDWVEVAGGWSSP